MYIMTNDTDKNNQIFPLLCLDRYYLDVIIFYEFALLPAVLGGRLVVFHNCLYGDDQIAEVKMLTLTKTKGTNGRKKLERLALIKERYKKLVLEPRKEIEFELEKDLEEESLSDPRFPSIAQV